MNGAGSKGMKQPSKNPPAGTNPGKSCSPKIMFLGSEQASLGEKLCFQAIPTVKHARQGSLLDQLPIIKALYKHAFKTMAVCSSYRGKVKGIFG